MDNTNHHNASRISTDSKIIRNWGEAHDAVPVEDITSTEETERFHIIPADGVGEAHEQLEWDPFLEMIDEWNYVVLYHGEQEANPFEIVKRDRAITRADMDADEFEERLLAGRPVTSTVTETTVVESVVVEETTIESELVGSEVIDQRVLDVEFIGRECTGCELIVNQDLDTREVFDADRYLDMRDGLEGEPGQTATGTLFTDEIPYHPEIDIEETWSVTLELVEQFTVESHVEDMDITETDTIEDHDIDVSGFHRKLVESGLLGTGRSPKEVMREFDIESEINKDDRIQTYFEREQIIEDEVIERKRLHADVTGGDLLEMETFRSEEFEPIQSEDSEAERAAADEPANPSEAEAPDVGEARVDKQDVEMETIHGEDTEATPARDDEFADEREAEVPEAEEIAVDEEKGMGTVQSEGTEVKPATDDESADERETEASEMTGTEAPETEEITVDEQNETTTPVDLTDAEIGKTVVDASGESIGRVTEAEEAEAMIYIDAHPSITDRIRAKFNWGNVDKGDLSIQADQIERVTDEQIELKGKGEPD
ncbi:hypothetical protein [Halosolutus gelatinilyticus]|uniref:hypothetical protein n=1 Tax=Halosolutus gelatinilyticus TaxID=2931975 RepID=UPI001FF48CE3|nr:hypothetical protein [Halosolutus gelatinilyticus]